MKFNPALLLLLGILMSGPALRLQGQEGIDVDTADLLIRPQPGAYLYDEASPPTIVDNYSGMEETDILSLGIGGGMDFGGFGTSLLIYPHKNIGVFGGLGYNLSGAGLNAGLRFRWVPDRLNARVHPYMLGMYGYNAVVTISNASGLDQVFYGTTFGAGIDYRTGRRGYMSIGLLLPIRKPEVREYLDYLENYYGVDFGTGLPPIALSIGFRLIIL